MNYMVEAVKEMFYYGSFALITGDCRVEFWINENNEIILKLFANKDNNDEYEIYNNYKMIMLSLSSIVSRSLFKNINDFTNIEKAFSYKMVSEDLRIDGANRLCNFFMYMVEDDRSFIAKLITKQDDAKSLCDIFLSKSLKFKDSKNDCDTDIFDRISELNEKTNTFIKNINCCNILYNNLNSANVNSNNYICAKNDWQDFINGNNPLFEMNKEFIPLNNTDDIKKEIDTSLLEEEHIAYEFIDEREYLVNPAVGRDNEKRLLGATLSSPTYSSILIGEPGIGKTAIIEGLAYDMKNNKCGAFFRNKKIMKISPSNIVSDTRYTGVFEKKMELLLKFLRENPDIILYMDEMHTAKGAGSHSKSDTDILDILKPYIENGSIKMIGATTLEEYEEFIKPDRAFASRFKNIEVKELSLNNLKEVIESNITKFEKMTDIEFCENASEGEKIIDILIELTDIKHQVWHEKRYNPRFILSIIEMAFGFGVYDKKETLDINSFIEAIEMESNLNESAKETAISDLKNMKIKEKNNKIIDFKKLVLK